MSDLAIRVENLSKQYTIVAARSRHDTLRDQIMYGLKSMFHRNGHPSSVSGLPSSVSHPPSAVPGPRSPISASDTIWALNEVSFEVREGDVVGIIGRNGSGKSTLLKILSRVSVPTSGYARICGRVGSLLEVGTGFHAELTGRENIYLNGAILGMKKTEIDRKFDEIVAFAETEKFIDTPVKHYSSGMYLRLAFAVAAHLEPEILIVDEVLAVGDARFQKKCLNKMQDVGHQGCTVLFVSHNMPAITRLCERVILLDGGRVFQDGPSHHVVSAYLNSGLGTMAAREWPDPAKAPGGEVARLLAVRIRSEDGRIIEAVDIRQAVRIEMEYEVLKPGYLLMPNFQFFNSEGLHIFSSHDTDLALRRCARHTGRRVSTVWIPGNLLTDGTMFVGVGLETVDPAIVQFYEPDAISFQVLESFDNDGKSARGDYGRHIGGVMRPLLKWTHSFDRTEAKQL